VRSLTCTVMPVVTSLFASLCKHKLWFSKLERQKCSCSQSAQKTTMFFIHLLLSKYLTNCCQLPIPSMLNCCFVKWYLLTALCNGCPCLLLSNLFSNSSQSSNPLHTHLFLSKMVPHQCVCTCHEPFPIFNLLIPCIFTSSFPKWYLSKWYLTYWEH